MDGFTTAGRQTCPSAVAKVEIFGMLILACDRALLLQGETRFRWDRRKSDGPFLFSGGASSLFRTLGILIPNYTYSTTFYFLV